MGVNAAVILRVPSLCGNKQMVGYYIIAVANADIRGQFSRNKTRSWMPNAPAVSIVRRLLQLSRQRS